MTPPGIDPGTVRLVTQRLNYCATPRPGKAISITYSERVSVALGIENVIRMRRIILPYVACLDVTDFLFPHKRQDFRYKKFIELKACFYFLHNFWLKSFSF